MGFSVVYGLNFEVTLWNFTPFRKFWVLDLIPFQMLLFSCFQPFIINWTPLNYLATLRPAVRKKKDILCYGTVCGPCLNHAIVHKRCRSNQQLVMRKHALSNLYLLQQFLNNPCRLKKEENRLHPAFQFKLICRNVKGKKCSSMTSSTVLKFGHSTGNAFSPTKS